MVVGDSNSVQCCNQAARDIGITVGKPCSVDNLIKPNFPKYRAINEVIAFILRRIDLQCESIGLTEFNIDATEFLKRAGRNTVQDWTTLADNLKSEILKVVNIKVNYGIGPTKIIAKISTLSSHQFEFQKYHDTLLDLTEIKFLPNFNTQSIYILNALGITLCKDITNNPHKAAKLFVNFTEHAFDSLVKMCLGVDKEHAELPYVLGDTVLVTTESLIEVKK